MSLYEIINPSDTYTMRCEDENIAITACLIIGYGQYGLKDLASGELVCPISIFGAVPLMSWDEEKIGQSFQDFFDSHLLELADCFDSVMIGSPNDRKLFETTLNNMQDQEQKEKFKLDWHENKRSSINNIGKNAWGRSKHCRRLHKERFDA